MQTKVIMPQLGESVTEGTIGKWLKKPGDRVELYEPLVEVVTDKVSVEVPSPAAGVLKEVLTPEGATVPVRTELAVIEEAGAGTAPSTGAAAPGAPRPTSAPEPGGPPPSRASAEPLVTPVVRRLAAEYAIDVSQIKGTGIGGRVTKDDVLRFVQERDRVKEAPATPQPAAPPTSRPPISPLPGDQPVPASPVRRQIAENMARSTRTAPHAWTMLEVDMSGVVKLRETLKEEFRQREAIELTYVPFVIKAVVEGLKQQPLMNSVWAEDRNIVRKEINIGVAVARDEGLIVPVIRQADQKSIAGLARSLHEIIQRARENKLTLQDVQGGTFTLNNPGAYGSVASFSIINYPQAAILNMEGIIRRPVIVNDAIAIRSMMNITLSFDHRAVDGHIVLQFLQTVKRTLEAMGPGTPVY